MRGDRNQLLYLPFEMSTLIENRNRLRFAERHLRLFQGGLLHIIEGEGLANNTFGGTKHDRIGTAPKNRKIVHVDMDAFYASVEQRDDARLRGKPVVVAWKGKRSVVCAASYEARTFGVRSAMPAITAERLCPEAIFIPPDFIRYKAVSLAVREIFQRHTDLIEPLSLDEAYLDVTENKTGLPTATRVAKMIRQEIREELHLAASAGVAPNKFLAKIASDWKKPDGLFVIQPHEVQDFLLPLPVGRVPGVGKVTEARMKEAGIKTVGDLYALELSALENLFGSYGGRLYQLARGIDHNPVVPNRVSKSISKEDTFEMDIPFADTAPVDLEGGYFRDGHPSCRHRASDPHPGGEGMDRIAQQCACRTNHCAQAEDEGVQHAHAQPYASRSTLHMRRVHRHCVIALRARRPWIATALPLGGRRSQ